MEPFRTGKSVSSEFGHPIVKNQKTFSNRRQSWKFTILLLNLLSHDTFNMTDPNSMRNVVINELNLLTIEFSMGR